jgi:putative N-acetyltransferase (TIGR04045 family)
VSATTELLSATPVERPREAVCHVARTTEDLAWHFAVRHAVFVVEQGIFARDPLGDVDERDDHPATLHVVGLAEGLTGGAVRLYPLDDEAGVWQGDRLAVLPAFRHGVLGAALVRFAVETAGALGGDRMVAQIQMPNVRFFEMLGWSRDGDVGPYHGVDHQPMVVALDGAVSRPAR